MKTRILVWVVAGLVVGNTAFGEENWMLRGGFVLGREKKKPTPAEQRLAEAQARHAQVRAELAAAHAPDSTMAALANTNNYRVVDGQLYNTALAQKWVTLPGPYHRGTFLRQTTDGPAFTLEVWNRGSDSLAGGWWSFDRVVIVRHYPLLVKVTGERMGPVRALPVGTSDFFEVPAAIYDCGTVTNALRAAR